YHADESGFHADIVTNELGTESKDPADVTIQSSAPTGAEAAATGPSGGSSSGVVRSGGHGGVRHAVVLFAVATLAAGRHAKLDADQSGYLLSHPESSFQRHEGNSNTQGRVSGSYSFKLPGGRERTVVYTADENGYRAEVMTNKLDTESKKFADVVIYSVAPTGAEAALLAPSASHVNRG
ncbi:cuticle protein 10.9-like, partial [Tropilaelaps mercedesae]